MSEKNNNKEKKSGNLFKIIIIVLLFMILIGGAVFAGMFISMKKAPVAQNTTESVKVNIDENTYGLDEFLVNLSDEGGKRYLKVKIFIGYDKKNSKLEKELEPKKPIMRDAVINVLRAKKASDVMSEKGSENLKKEILDRINPLLNNGKLTNIYFYDMLVQ